MTVDRTDDIYEHLAVSGEIPPYLPTLGEEQTEVAADGRPMASVSTAPV